MIFIDGVETKINVKEFESELEREGLRFPLKFQLLQEPPFKWWDEINKKTRYVPVWGIPAAYVKFNEQGQPTKVQYALTHIKEKDKDVFTPSNVEFENGHPIILGKKDIDLAYFLFYHTWRKGSGEFNHAEDDVKACFFLENKKKEAQVITEASQKKARAFEILYTDLSGEPDRKRDIAKAMGHIGVDILSDLEVTAILAQEIEKNSENFIYYTEGQHTVVKARVRHAIDNNLIAFENSTRTWYWVIQSSGLRGDPVYQVPPTQNTTEGLYEFFLSNTRAFNVLASAVSSVKSLSTEATPNKAELQAQAKAAGIKGWQVMGEETLRKKLKEAQIAA